MFQADTLPNLFLVSKKEADADDGFIVNDPSNDGELTEEDDDEEDDDKEVLDDSEEEEALPQ